MIKSVYDEALDMVNESLEEPDDSVIFKHTGLNELKKALEQAKKQEKLLKLYQKLYKIPRIISTLDEQLDIEKHIKELEDDK